MLRHLNDDGPTDSKIWPSSARKADADLVSPIDENLIKPEQIESSKPEDHLSAQQKSGNLDPEEILTKSLSNTYSTIQSLGGELSALRNNLE